MLAAINLAGFLYGLYYYWPQLTHTPAWLWIFVIDCPLYAILFAITFAMAFKGVKNNAFAFITATGAFKYGLWTIIVLPFFGEYFFTPQNAGVSFFLFIAHIGLFLEGLLLAGALKVTPKIAGIGLLWMLLNDFLDWFPATNTHPFLPQVPEKLAITAAITISLSFLTLAAFYFAGKQQFNAFKQNKFLTKIRKTAT